MKVSIITINFNSSLFTLKLVDSILEHISSGIEYEIIIIDNASEDRDYQALESKLPRSNKIKLLRNKTNNVFSGGNMDGFYRSSGDYLLFINNDCEIKNDVLSPLLKYIEQNKSAGLLTGKVRGKDGRYSGAHKLFPSLTRSLFGNKFARMISKHKFISPKESVTTPTKVQVVTGAFMFFERSLFIDIGGFDTNFFLYCEEEDISIRVWKSGKAVYILPEPEVIHNHGSSSKTNSELIKHEYYISYKKLVFKHYNFIYARIMLAMTYIKIFKFFVQGKCSTDLLILALKGFPEKNSLRYLQND